MEATLESPNFSLIVCYQRCPLHVLMLQTLNGDSYLIGHIKVNTSWIHHPHNGSHSGAHYQKAVVNNTLQTLWSRETFVQGISRSSYSLHHLTWMAWERQPNVLFWMPMVATAALA